MASGLGVSMLRWVPGLQVISSYRRPWLLKDVIAGVVLTTLLVPQGMAYAELAGLPPITGLYTSILACSATRRSGRRGSWCWDRIPRWGR
jgi:MFS superfamily sulfate permease-like transporter